MSIAKVSLSCSVCKKEFDRYLSEHKRNQKLGRRIYCSLKCCGEDNIGNLPEYTKGVIPNHLVGYIGKSGWGNPFKHYIRRINARQHDVDVTVEDLESQWILQNGICVYTGWSLVHPDKGPAKFNQASVDRIDSTLGYIKGNIQFVSLIAQFAKYTWGNIEIFKFCKSVVEYNNLILAT